jgi:hypothetical protein
LMKAANPSLGYAAIRSGLISSSDSVEALQGKVVANGRVNAYRAVVAAVSGEIPPEPTAIPTAVPTSEPPVAMPGRARTGAVLSITSRRYGQRILISGRIRNSSRKPLVNKIVALRCQVAATRRVRSDKDGFYAFRLSPKRRADRCFVRDEFNNRSRGVLVR